ncbi:MAG: ribonuclease HII [Gammaproteobacteria bacterium]|uniref:Ribonuclease HII n=1 Tax=Candidatus Thiopontia autotrophica TaxID=2841688 RepID=A0A8J6P4D9_9GAMM|nr:ribonuclease HII [Candidatus Thiopontia autotrophica]MBL6968912.1 ribonuclease HII [Gammaproteobacteria bacterium]
MNSNGQKLIAGVDEVGRGPLAGPVVAAAVVLPEDHGIKGLADSKKLTPKKRERLSKEIMDHAIGWAIAEASRKEIDEINILHASLLAMRRAVETLQCAPSLVLVDGNRIPPGLTMAAEAVVGGDAKIESISAASILAKVARDQMMVELHQHHPQYGFDSHKGYPTRQHIAALQQHGALDQHRRSFRPVRKALGL